MKITQNYKNVYRRGREEVDSSSSSSSLIYFFSGKEDFKRSVNQKRKSEEEP